MDGAGAGLSSLDLSDLLFEGSPGSVGSSVSGGGLHRLVGHDAGGELLLRLLEAGAGGPVQRMDLKTITRGTFI